MGKILITGYSGFVASHFVEYLYNADIQLEICGVDVKTPVHDYDKFKDKLDLHFRQVNMIDFDDVCSVINDFKPDYILHLASFSSVAYSWKNPTLSFMNNCNIFLNLIDVVREICPQCRILSVGSSEEYGNVKKSELPLTENQQTNPINPYAVARTSQELLSKVFVNAYGMNIIMTRSFNHIGTRQDSSFVIPSFIKRINEIKESGQNEGIIETGDLSIVRDFVDVRDVVRAYYILLTKGRSGEIYNICSGKGTTLKQIVDMISELVGVRVNTKINPSYIRPEENMEIIGSPKKIHDEFGWECEYSLEETLKEVVMFGDY